MVEKNENFLGTRVSEKLLKEIEDYSTIYKKSKSKFIRDAIIFYLKYAQEDDKTYHPMMIFSKEEMKYMFQNMNDYQLQEFAQLSYQMGQKSKKHFTKQMSIESDLKIRPRFLIEALKSEVFSYHGQNWFSKIEVNPEPKSIAIAGTHLLGINFSIFFKFLVSYYLEGTEYILTTEIIKENIVSLVFTKR